MEVMDELSFKILADGQQKIQINEFRDIDVELGFSEKKLQQSIPEKYSSIQTEFNSAELINSEKRAKYSVIAYELTEINSIYNTRDFKLFKFCEIESVAKYLRKLISLLNLINKNYENTTKELTYFDKSKHSENYAQYYCAKDVVSSCFSLMCEIKANIDEIIYDENCISVKSSYEELNNALKIQLSLHTIPASLAEVINTIFPGIPLTKFETEKIDNKNWPQFSFFCSWVQKLDLIFHYFVENLINEFSYFFTSEEFLNNPIGKTVFVVPFHLYKKLNFRKSGLFRKERFFLETSTTKDKVYKKYKELYSEINDELKKILKITKTEKELAVNLSGETEIENFISAYLNKYQNTTYGSISKLEIHLEDPCLLEKFEELLLTTRYFLISKLDDGKNPWEIKNFRSLDMKQKDIDTVVFFTIFYRYYFNQNNTRYIPQAQICRLLNLFAHTQDPLKRINTHFAKYCKEDNIESLFSASFWEEFYPILLK